MTQPSFTTVLQYLTRPVLFLIWSASHLVAPAYAQDALHQPWHNLLTQHVYATNNGHSTALDYAAMQQHQPLLSEYLNKLSKVDTHTFDSWPKSYQLAFLINAYNAWTVNFILTEYPDLASIKDLGHFFSSPWDKAFIPLLGETISLNNIEHDLIRGSDRYNDPRIHFAVNCASIGCPALRAEAYTGSQLENQLNEQTERFLSDIKQNNAQGNTLYLSSIFKWYEEDFTTGFHDTYSIQQFLGLYSDILVLTKKQKSALSKDAMKVKFLDYNWKLNDRL